MRKDHTWLVLHSSINDLQCGPAMALINGVSDTPERAMRTSQVHFLMLLRMVGIESDGHTVTGHRDPVDSWPDPRLS